MKIFTLAILIVLKIGLISTCLFALPFWLFFFFSVLTGFENAMPGSTELFFSYIFFGLWFAYGIFSGTGILRWKSLLVSGILMQCLLILAAYFAFELLGNQSVKIATASSLLWWAHFTAQYFYQTKNSESQLR